MLKIHCCCYCVIKRYLRRFSALSCKRAAYNLFVAERGSMALAFFWFFDCCLVFSQLFIGERLGKKGLF